MHNHVTKAVPIDFIRTCQKTPCCINKPNRTSIGASGLTLSFSNTVGIIINAITIENKIFIAVR